MLRGKFITLNAYFEKEERFQINDLSFHPEKREKEKQINDLELKIKNIREKSGKYKIIKGNKIPENKIFDTVLFNFFISLSFDLL